MEINKNDWMEKYVNEIIDAVKQVGYEINKDWCFKACKMLTNAPMDMHYSEMPEDLFKVIYNNQNSIKDSIIKAFEIVADFSIEDNNLTTKLPIIPIAYFIYNRHLAYSRISSPNIQLVYEDICIFLNRALATHLLESNANEVLNVIKEIMDNTPVPTNTEKVKNYQAPKVEMNVQGVKVAGGCEIIYFPYDEIAQKYDL